MSTSPTELKADALYTDLDSIVSFIIVPARKGFQAANVTITDPPKQEDEAAENEAPLEEAMEEMNVNGANGTTNGNTTADTATDGDWGGSGW